MRRYAVRLILCCVACAVPARSPAHAQSIATALRDLHWQADAAGVEHARTTMSAGLFRVQLIIVRFNPARLRPSLVTLTDASRVRGTWTVDSTPPSAILAFNAGQFAETGPWGWLVRDGVEWLPPGSGPLVRTVAFLPAGGLVWPSTAEVRKVRQGADMGIALPWTLAFQSYPSLVENGRIPSQVTNGYGMDAGHRDIRLALGELADGRAILVLTRFGAEETALSRAPWGLTTRETAELMRSLGARDAVMLDGGLSAQLYIASATGAATSTAGASVWRGGRRVPLALVFYPR